MIDDIAGERGHAGEAVSRGDAVEDDGAGGAAGDDEFVEGTAAVVAGVAENQAGGVEGDFRPAIPGG